MTYKSILEEVYSEFSLSSSVDRRDSLNTSMKKLNQEGKDCSKCSGMCCTYAHNSMLITPLEALEILEYLDRKSRLDKNLIVRLEKSVEEFRLDKELNVGPGKEFRRNYTCPFFNERALGCSISPKYKPYGCLGFNSTEPNVNTAGSCKVHVEAHEEREKSFLSSEKQANTKLAEKLNLYWSKKSIPIALLELIKSIKQMIQ